VDGSGAISTDEFDRVLVKIGRDPAEGASLTRCMFSHCYTTTADGLLMDVDPDRSGSLTFEEFVTVVSKRKSRGAYMGFAVSLSCTIQTQMQ
jgi:hypothetical protein